ncbi:acyl-CoA thioesterase [bacterium]|nr:acyl-CoA thioesterase [bacterium]MBU1984147.1 acyl-CoA thioesterase [bacterium]
MSSLFHHPYTVGLHDTDAAGVLYSANIIRICMIGYEALLEDIGFGLPVLFQRRTMSLPIVHLEADFEKPLTAGQRVVLLIRVERIGNTSYRLAYEVQDAAGVTCATAATVHVCTDLKTHRSMDIPSDFRAALETYV